MATSQNLIQVFEYALNQEYTGKTFFESAVQRMGIGAAVSAFKRLIEEEEKHIKYISTIIENLKQGTEFQASQVREIVIEPTNYFDARARDEFLEQCVVGSMVPDVTVFSTAWLIEKDLSEFYASMARQTEGEAKEAFIMLSGWEHSHERFFREFRDKLQETYALMPWGG